MSDTRRAFVKRSAGAAVGATMLGALLASEADASAAEPVVAYVRDARRGEVTVTSGTAEHTYRDRALVQRLLRAAKKGVS